MKIAHISDLHISSMHKFNNVHLLKIILNHLNENGVEHLVITGDLTDNADKTDYKLLRNIFCDYGFLDSKKLSLVIGNHDIFGGIVTAEDIVNFPKKCLNTNYKQKMKEFYSYFIECFDNCFFPSGSDRYPYVKEVGNCVLIGLNSIAKYSRIKNAFASNGKVTKSQIKSFDEIFRKNEYSDKKRVVMIHHHFCKYYQKYEYKNSIWANVEKFTLKLRGKKSLIDSFVKHKIDLVLHGHLHESFEYDKNGIRFLNAGGSIDNNGESYLKINLIETYSSGIESKIITLPKYKFDKNAFSYSKKMLNSIAI
jgi:3',5'-cyclic AMP phosphodiesterase CpdA